jgi:predicted transposase YbfD/YdcC
VVSLDDIQVVLVTGLEEQRRFQKLLKQHHYLGGLKPVGERMYYVAVDGRGNWLALLLFSAAAKHLKPRDLWIGWTRPQRDGRLPLVVNNSRFLILPQAHLPNLGSRVLRLTLDRLSADWLARYQHPVLVVETFVDPEQFQGTVYTANGWQEAGLTDGCGRTRRDYYVQHNKPKRLFVRELVKHARRSLQAEHLKPALAGVEKKAGARCYYKCPELKSLSEHFKALPEYRDRVESYPVWSLVTLMLVAMLCDAPRGQKDLAKLARRLTQHQRRALGIRPNPKGFFPAPSQSTFSRLLAQLDGVRLNRTLQQIQAKVRGPVPAHELIVVDGKEPRHGPGDAILSAVTVPSQFYLGSALVDTKTNEIPIARQLFGQMDLAGRTVALDALHTQDQTARELVMEHGAHFLMTVKNNQPTLRQNIGKSVPQPPVGFSPSAGHAHSGAHRGKEQGSARKPDPGKPSRCG